jgi:CIC family chloride channel protein
MTWTEPTIWLYVTVLGVCTGVLGATQSGLLRTTARSFTQLPIPLTIRLGLAGALVGSLGYFVVSVHDLATVTALTRLFSETFSPGWLVIIIIAKLLAVAITIGSGNSGGIFVPSLFIGALAGALVGGIFPTTEFPVAVLLILGMGGALAGTIHAPLTAAALIFEITTATNLLFPLFGTVILATLTSRLISSQNAYSLVNESP